MSQVIVTPSPATSFRRFVTRVWEDPDSRSTAIGLIAVVIVHLLLMLIVPHLLRLESAPSVLRPHSSSRQFNIEITPETFTKPVPKPPAPKQFVETNPDAPENTPDRTNNFAAQNQQVAQEKPTPNGESERPATEGKKDFQSTQIVSGRLEKPQEAPPSPPEVDTPPLPPNATAPRAEQNPLTGFEKKQGDSPDAFGTNVATNPANSRPIPERVEGMKDVPLVEGALGMQPAIDPKRPRARPMIVKQQQVRPGILAENKFGTKNIGPTAVNAKFSEYGLYLQRLVEAVQLKFDELAGNAKAYPPTGTYVVVKFILTPQGTVARISGVDKHTTDIGAQIAVTSITERAPYGEWPDDMKAALNEEEELIFTFHYE